MDIDNLVSNEQEFATSDMKLEMKQGYSGANYQGGVAGPYPQQGGAAGQYPQQGGVPGPYPQQGGAAGPYPQQGGIAGPNQPQGGYQSQPGVPPPAGDVPSHDESEPSAPSADSMDQLPGYSNIGFEGAALPPPSYDEASRGPPPSRENIQSASVISEQDARDAIIQHATENCCYGKTPAVEMKFTDMKSSNAFHYTLETFGERRSTKWTSQPYQGEGVVVTGSPPGPWDIQAQPPQMFVTSTLDVEVPNTASVKPCFMCNARGFKTCFSCFGRGRTMCSSCGGTGRETYFENGRHHHRSCIWCSGGWKMCYHCSGSGKVICHKCQGRGNLRWFILLTIQWTNHLDDHIVERTALPDELIRTVRGQTAFEETYPRVWAVNHFPVQEINAASNQLVNRHGSQFTAERILMQRHRVRIVPVTEVTYAYKNQNSAFFVYGEEHKVYAPDYPAKCCWGCTVL